MWNTRGNPFNYGHPPNPNPLLVPGGSWNKTELELLGQSLRFRVNGVDIQRTRLDQLKLPPDSEPLPGMRLREGSVGFQAYEVSRFRNIEIKELQGPGSARGFGESAGAKDPQRGFVQLFNGKDATGWKTHPSQPGNWHVENGVLIGSGQTVSHIYSERGDYTDFHLHVEARINNGGNSGVYARASFGPVWPAEAPKYPHGYEAQIQGRKVTGGNTGSLFVGANTARGRCPQGASSRLPVVQSGHDSRRKPGRR